MLEYEKTRERLVADGFEGFVSIAELWGDKSTTMPREPGIYVVLYTSNRLPNFIDKCPVPYHLGRSLSYELADLEYRWIEGCSVLYFGKASSLHNRIGRYLRFGNGERAPHRGGRAIWQISPASDLILAWRRCQKGCEPALEWLYIDQFKAEHDGMLPFANRTTPPKPKRTRA